jgi:hypothetical protein
VKNRDDELSEELAGAGVHVPTPEESRDAREAIEDDLERLELGAIGGDRSTLPSFDAWKLRVVPPPVRVGHVFAWDDAAHDVYPVNPKGPGILGTACGLPVGGHNHGGQGA